MGGHGVIPFTGLPPLRYAASTPSDTFFDTNSSNSTIPQLMPIAGGCGRSDFNYTQHGIRCPPPTQDPTVEMMRRVAEVYVSMPIAILGIIGNLLSLIVLCYHRRMQKLHTILIQLQALAVADTLILMSTLLLRSFRYVLPATFYAGYHSSMFVWLYPITYVLRLFGIWLTVLLTVDRYIAVWYPLDAKRLCTTHRTYLLMVGILVGSVGFSLPRFFEYYLKTYPTGHVGFAASDLVRNKSYTIAYSICMFIIFQYIVPTFILVALNARVIVALRRSDTYRSSVVATPVGRRSMGLLGEPDAAAVIARHQQPSHVPPVGSTFQSTRSITVVVTAIVTMCIVVHLVALAAHVVWSTQKLVTTKQASVFLEPLRRHLAQASNVLVTLNSAVNFLIYCVFSRNFRSVLVRRFGLLSPLNIYRRRAAAAAAADDRKAGGCVYGCWLSTCGAHYRQRRHRRSTGCDTGENTGGSKRSTTLLSDSRSNGTTTRLTPIPCGARFGEIENGAPPLCSQPSPADVGVPCL